jgi:hypothetical protein
MRRSTGFILLFMAAILPLDQAPGQPEECLKLTVHSGWNRRYR